MFRFVSFVFVIAMLACQPTVKESKTVKTEAKPEKAAPNVGVPIGEDPIIGVTGLPKEQAKVMQDARAALRNFAKKSAKARELLAFYDRNVVVAEYLSEGKVRVLTAGKDKEYFLLVASPSPVEIESGKGGGIAAEFHCTAQPRMTLYPMTNDSFSQGFFLAHELSHAVDCTKLGEPRQAQRLSPPWLKGEYQAHITMRTILNELTADKWGKVVNQAQKRRVKHAASKGLRPESFTSGTFPEDLAALEKLFPDIKKEHLGGLLAQLEIEAGLVNVEVQAKRYGKNRAFSYQQQLNYLAFFYQQLKVLN